jgi:hypothetical protein
MRVRALQISAGTMITQLKAKCTTRRWIYLAKAVLKIVNILVIPVLAQTEQPAWHPAVVGVRVEVGEETGGSLDDTDLRMPSVGDESYGSEHGQFRDEIG